MHEMQIVTDVRDVSQSVCGSVTRGSTRLQCAGSFGTAFAKSLWPLVSVGEYCQVPIYR